MAASPSGVARVVFVKPDGGDLPSAPPPKLVAFVFGIAGARKAVEEQKGFYGDRSVTLCYKSPFDDDELVALETVSDWETAVQLTKLCAASCGRLRRAALAALLL